MKSLTNYIVESQQVKLDSDGKEHEFDYVDLGLPSGTKWATCNVGADKPEDNGLLFQFGEVDGYEYGDINNTFTVGKQNEELTGFYNINPTASGKKYYKGQILSLEDDAAHINMGGNWIMPTKDDLQELYDNTTKQVMTINCTQGMLFTSNINGKSIFITFDGCWYYDNGQFYDGRYGGGIRSSEVYSRGVNTAWFLNFDPEGHCGVYTSPRANGFSVRGVFKK